MSEHLILWEEAKNDLLAGAAFIAERIKNGEGRAEAMRSVVPRYLARGNVDLAAALADTVEDPFSRDKLLILVAQKCVELDDDEYAIQIAEAIEDLGLQAQAFQLMGIQMAGKDNLEGARGIAEIMMHPDFVYGAIAERQAADGDEAAAFETLESIEFAGARVSALQAIAVFNLHDGNKEKAAEYLEKAVATAGEIEHDEEQIRAFCDLSSLFIEAGRNDKAIETLEIARQHAEALDNVHRDNFLATVALSLLHAGSIEFADRTLDMVTDKTQIASCLLGFARHYWNREEKDEAVETLEEAYASLKSQRDIETRDSRARFALLGTIAVQFAGFGKTERGMEIAQDNADENEQMSAFSQIAHILTFQREDDLARQAVAAIGEDSNRILAITGMSEAKMKIGAQAEAIEILKEAAVLAETVPQLRSRVTVYNELGSRFVDLGELETGRDVLNSGLETIEQVRDDSGQAAALANISEVYTTANFELSDHERGLLERIARHL